MSDNQAQPDDDDEAWRSVARELGAMARGSSDPERLVEQVKVQSRAAATSWFARIERNMRRFLLPNSVDAVMSDPAVVAAMEGFAVAFCAALVRELAGAPAPNETSTNQQRPGDHE